MYSVRSSGVRAEGPKSGCPLCGEARRAHLFAKDGYPIVRCSRCGLVFVDAEISTAELESRYGEQYYTGGVFHDYIGERAERIASARVHCDLLAQLEPRGRLLDVGCAAGFFLEAAATRWEVTGVEFSPYAADFARRTLGHRVLTGDIAGVDLDGAPFDVVTLWNTIEHMSDPVKAIAHVAKVVAPGGLVVITTGNVSGPMARRSLQEWDLMVPPEHLFFFSPETLTTLLHDAGLRVRRIVQDGIVAHDGLLARPAARTVASALGLGNVMTVYARRPVDSRVAVGDSVLRRLRPVSQV
jgi:2-polyprenyl-3-methyl-5-hydroxy-6-metoxy-1,4-benzoquinol methylase